MFVLIFGMSDESRDFAAAKNEFNEVFRQVPNSVRKELYSEFVKAFVINYRHVMAHEVPPEKYSESITSSWSSAIDGLRLGYDLGIREYNQHLGGSLGVCLAAVEKFIIPLEPKMVSALSNRILDLNNELATTLRSSGKHVKGKFIRWRLEAITKKYRAKLTPQKIELLSRMAAQFA